jgi:hypothetical protein
MVGDFIGYRFDYRNADGDHTETVNTYTTTRQARIPPPLASSDTYLSCGSIDDLSFPELQLC